MIPKIKSIIQDFFSNFFSKKEELELCYKGCGVEVYGFIQQHDAHHNGEIPVCKSCWKENEFDMQCDAAFVEHSQDDPSTTLRYPFVEDWQRN